MASLVGVLVYRKTADETVNNSTTLQNDDIFSIPIIANENWYFEAHIFYRSTAVADIKFAFTTPAGATLSWSIIEQAVSGAARYPAPITVSGTAESASGRGASTDSGCYIQGLIRNGANIGSLTLQWAQNTAEVSDTTVQTLSWLMKAADV